MVLSVVFAGATSSGLEVAAGIAGAAATPSIANRADSKSGNAELPGEDTAGKIDASPAEVMPWINSSSALTDSTSQARGPAPGRKGLSDPRLLRVKDFARWCRWRVREEGARKCATRQLLPRGSGQNLPTYDGCGGGGRVRRRPAARGWPLRGHVPGTAAGAVPQESPASGVPADTCQSAPSLCFAVRRAVL